MAQVFPLNLRFKVFVLPSHVVAKIQSIISDVAVMEGKELTVVNSNVRGGLDSFG